MEPDPHDKCTDTSRTTPQPTDTMQHPALKAAAVTAALSVPTDNSKYPEEMRELAAEIRNVLQALLEELKRTNLDHASADDDTSRLARRNGLDLSTSAELPVATKQNPKINDVAGLLSGLVDDVTPDHMQHLSELFLKGPTEDSEEDEDASPPHLEKIGVPGYPDLISLETYGVVLTIQHASDERPPQRRLFGFRARKPNNLDQHSLSIADFYDKLRHEWQAQAPIDKRKKRITWYLGYRGWRKSELLHFQGRHDATEVEDKQRWIGDNVLVANEYFIVPVRTWQLWLDDGPIGIARVSYLYALLGSLMTEGSPYCDFDFANEFFWTFVGKWRPSKYRTHSKSYSTTDSSRSYDPENGHCFAQTITIRAEHHLRMISVVYTQDLNQQHWEDSGLIPCRLKGEFPSSSLGASGSTSFRERRISLSCYEICLRNHMDIDSAARVIILGDITISKRQNVGIPIRNLAACTLLVGLYQFQCSIFRCYELWEEEWHRCLDKVDACVEVKLGDIGSPDMIDELMFDDSFARSKVYLATLQLLRIFSDLIREPRKDQQDSGDYESMFDHWHLQELKSRGLELFGEVALTDIDTLGTNWKLVLRFQREAEDRLLDRIAAKTAQIESLRDGLFNATSVREAARSTSMNRSIIIFTVVTITYLPASLVATVFGTQLFNDEEVGSTINKYKIATVIVSLSTFAVATVLVFLASKLPYIKRSSTYRQMKERFERRFRKRSSNPRQLSDTDSHKRTSKS